MKKLIIPLCYNDIGYSVGVTERRIDTAVIKSTKHRGFLYCVCSAGYSKINPSVPCTSRMTSLADQMLDYLVESHGGGNEVKRGKLGWGTLHEMIESIRAAYGWGFTASDLIIICSSVDHIPRIRKYAWWIIPNGWKVEYHAIDHRLNEPLKEQVKFLKDLPCLIWFRLKTALGFPL